jgi:hypothetical protein
MPWEHYFIIIYSWYRNYIIYANLLSTHSCPWTISVASVIIPLCSRRRISSKSFLPTDAASFLEADRRWHSDMRTAQWILRKQHLTVHQFGKWEALGSASYKAIVFIPKLERKKAITDSSNVRHYPKRNDRWQAPRSPRHASVPKTIGAGHSIMHSRCTPDALPATYMDLLRLDLCVSHSNSAHA